MIDEVEADLLVRAGVAWSNVERLSLYSSAIVPLSRPRRLPFFTGREAGSRIGGEESPFVDTNVLANRYPVSFVVTRVAVLMRSSVRGLAGEALMAAASAGSRLRVWVREPGLVERPMSAVPTLVRMGWFFGAELSFARGSFAESPLLAQVVLDVLLERTT